MYKIKDNIFIGSRVRTKRNSVHPYYRKMSIRSWKGEVERVYHSCDRLFCIIKLDEDVVDRMEKEYIDYCKRKGIDYTHIELCVNQCKII